MIHWLIHEDSRSYSFKSCFYEIGQREKGKQRSSPSLIKSSFVSSNSSHHEVVKWICCKTALNEAAVKEHEIALQRGSLHPQNVLSTCDTLIASLSQLGGEMKENTKMNKAKHINTTDTASDKYDKKTKKKKKKKKRPRDMPRQWRCEGWPDSTSWNWQESILRTFCCWTTNL